MTIKKTFLFVWLWIGVLTLNAQVDVDLDGINSPSLKAKIEKNIARFLNNLNKAYDSHSERPFFDGVYIKDTAKINIEMMWATSPFKVQDLEIYEHILKRLPNKEGIAYEVRNIRLYFKNADKGEHNQEGVIYLAKDGKILDFGISISYKQYQNVMAEGTDVKELRRRQMILDFVENFRTAYNRKDIDFLEKVFSDDALIIVGHKVKKVEGGTGWGYTKMNKREYLNRLKKVFARNEFVNVKFDNIKVVQHRRYKYLYGVTVKQKWHSTTYSDEGYVFLLIDFKDEDHPLIHVRTWDKEDNWNIESFAKEMKNM